MSCQDFVATAQLLRTKQFERAKFGKKSPRAVDKIFFVLRGVIGSPSNLSVFFFKRIRSHGIRITIFHHHLVGTLSEHLLKIIPSMKQENPRSSQVYFGPYPPWNSNKKHLKKLLVQIRFGDFWGPKGLFLSGVLGLGFQEGYEFSHLWNRKFVLDPPNQQILQQGGPPTSYKWSYNPYK